MEDRTIFMIAFHALQSLDTRYYDRGVLSRWSQGSVKEIGWNCVANIYNTEKTRLTMELNTNCFFFFFS